MVVACAAPLTVVVGVPPIVFGVASNVAPALGFVLSGALLLIFSVGYTAMSRFVSGPGGFAVYVENAFGRESAASAAFVALIGYAGFLFGIFGLFGYIAAPLFASQLHISLSWWVWSLLAICVVGAMGYRNVNLSARVLAVALTAEILITLIMDFGILFKGGQSGIDAAGFSVSNLLAGAPGLVIMFAIASYVGFESTTLYGEEVSNRNVTIPRATYIAVVIITVFYSFTFWALGIGYGSSHVIKAAQTNPGSFTLNLAEKFVGTWASDTMNWLVLSSIVAATLAFHNAFARYMFSLGRVGLFPRSLGNSHVAHGSPHFSSLVTSIISAVVIIVFALFHGDPYLQLYGLFIAVATVGIILLYVAGAASVLFFLRRGDRDRRLWHSLVAPVIATLGLLGALYLAIYNFSAMTGSTNALINLMWLIAPVAAVVGALIGRSFYRRNPGSRGLSGEMEDESLGLE
jgi:amino acid transporter